MKLKKYILPVCLILLLGICFATFIYVSIFTAHPVIPVKIPSYYFKLTDFLIFYGSWIRNFFTWQTNSVIYLPITFILMYLAYSLSTYIHLLGYAFGAWCMGSPIEKIYLGVGKNLYKTQIKGSSTVLYINKSFEGGFVSLGDISLDNLRTKVFFFILGGNILSSFFLIICLLLKQVLILFNISQVVNFLGENIINIIVFMNCLTIIFNFIPFKINLGGFQIATDGFNLLKILTEDQEYIQTMLEMGRIQDKIYDVVEKNRLGKYSEAEAILRECLSRNDQLLDVKKMLFTPLMNQLKVDEALDLLRELNNTKKQLTQRDKFDLFLRMAFVCLVKSTKDRKFIDEAYLVSNKAYQLYPDETNIISIRGSILIELGQVNEGIKMLEKNEFVRANSSVYLAYGYFLKQEWKKWRKYLKKIDKVKISKNPISNVLYESILERTNNFAILND